MYSEGSALKRPMRGALGREEKNSFEIWNLWGPGKKTNANLVGHTETKEMGCAGLGETMGP